MHYTMKSFFIALIIFSFAFVLVFQGMSIAYAEDAKIKLTNDETLKVRFATEPSEPKPNSDAKMKIDFLKKESEEIQEHIDYTLSVTKSNEELFNVKRTHTSTGAVTIPYQFPENGKYTVTINVSGILFQPIPEESVLFPVSIGNEPDSSGETPQGQTTNQSAEDSETENSEGGGCLIATAAYGSELAPQVQQLREIRDSQLMSTEAGSAFMELFNQFYYSFSPTIADYERENPAFKETVKVTLVPLITSLSVLNHVDVDSEESVLGYGIGLILLNLGMYLAGPTVVIMKVGKMILRKSKSA